jgi:formyl-CoA transferase
MKDERARAIAKKLALEADIIIENYRPGVLEKWDIGYEQLKAVKPSTIMVRLSGFGQTGPMKDQPGFGAIGESMGGLRYVSGHADRPPVRVGVSIGDSVAALHGVIGALMALRHREVNGGEGQVVDVALYEAIFAMMESMVPEFDVFGFIRERTGNIMPGITPSSIHTSADGKHVQIGANGDAIFKRFMLLIGREDLANDPLLASNDGRDSRRDEIYGVIDRWVNSLPLDTVIAQLNQADVPASRIFSAEDMFSDPQYLAREMFLQAKLPDGKDFKMPGIVPKLSETPGDCEWVGPQLGEHNAQVLQELGYDASQITQLRKDGAI